jgi:hypothetical protein
MNAQAQQIVATPVDQLPLASAPTESPAMTMVREAVAAGQPLEVIRELKALAKEMAEEEADRAFKAAFAAFKGEVITVVRAKLVNDGPLKGRKYAELHSFVDAATPALSRHGLSASWETTRDEKDWIEVTCIIEHAMGGRKRVSLGGPPDTGGAKNILQARISTVTYLERATFKMACGLAEQGQDDDGAGGSSGEVINAEQVAVLRALLDETSSDTAKFCQVMKVDALPSIPASKFNDAVAKLNAKKQRVQP